MATSIIKSQFLSSALASGLVSQAELEPVVRGCSFDPSLSTEDLDQQLADKIIEVGLLTRYQAEQLLRGNRKLTLGPYRVTDSIGQGGMGHVFKAEHILMGRVCAIKVLPRHKSTPEAIASFTREIRAQALLDHPNLVRAYDAGHDGNVYYLVTEFVPGTDLRRYVRERGPLSVAEAATIIAQGANGLEHAHRLGLIHRDVKPGNILVTPDGRTKVSDLGLAASLNGEDDPRAGKIVGTADYLSPEQILSPRDAGPASDVYSLGCTLYYAVTGKVPFPGGTAREKARRHCEDTPLNPRHFNPTLTTDFIEVIAEMMVKDVHQRIQTMRDVVGRLSPWVQSAAMVAEPAHTHEAVSVPLLPVLQMRRLDEEVEASLTEVFCTDLPQTDSPSQISQGTDPVASANQDTLPFDLRRRNSPGHEQNPWSDPALFFVLAPILVIVGMLLLSLLFLLT